jgi:hypothetical protein
MVLAAVTAVVSGYSYFTVGKVCLATGTSDYKNAWAKTVSPSTSWIPSLAIIMQVSHD